jgi:hypothetical protein
MDDPYITTVLPVIVPRHVLLHVTLHEALHPVTLAHVAHEFDRRAIYETKMFDCIEFSFFSLLIIIRVKVSSCRSSYHSSFDTQMDLPLSPRSGLFEKNLNF